MAFPKGKPNPNAGRPAGSCNRSTDKAREAIAQLIDGNADRLMGWLEAVADENPKDAINAWLSVCEYHIPKLARQELVGKDGAPLTINVLRLGDDPEALEKARLQLEGNSGNAIDHQRDEIAQPYSKE